MFDDTVEALQFDPGIQLDPSSIALVAEIGMGHTAAVFEGTLHKGTLLPVAVKRFFEDFTSSDARVQEEVSRELQILAKVSHPNVVHLCGVVLQSPMMIVTELCRGGVLFELLHNQQDLDITWKQKVKMCSDTAAGIGYLHSLTPMILHRDLKSLNLVLRDKFAGKESDEVTVKVCDFGLSRLRDRNMTFSVGTCNWTAPELLRSGAGQYTEKVDVYSFSMVTFEVICREVPFEEEMDPVEVIKLVRQGNRPDLEAIPPDCPPLFQDLMKKCWDAQPSQRPDFGMISQVLVDLQRAL